MYHHCDCILSFCSVLYAMHLGCQSYAEYGIYNILAQRSCTVRFVYITKQRDGYYYSEDVQFTCAYNPMRLTETDSDYYCMFQRLKCVRKSSRME